MFYCIICDSHTMSKFWPLLKWSLNSFRPVTFLVLEKFGPQYVFIIVFMRELLLDQTSLGPKFLTTKFLRDQIFRGPNEISDHFSTSQNFATLTFARVKKWAQDVNTSLVGQAVPQEYNLVRKVSCLSTIFLHFVFEGRQFVVLQYYMPLPSACLANFLGVHENCAVIGRNVDHQRVKILKPLILLEKKIYFIKKYA